MGLIKTLTGLAIATATTVAIAAPKPDSSALSYDHLGIRYIDQDLDQFDCGQDGLNLYGSMIVKDNIFVLGSFSDVSGGGCGSSALSAGAGVRGQLNPDVDMFATLSYQSISPDVGNSDNGLVLSAGLRTFLTKEIEGSASVFHSTTGDGETGISGQALYWFHERYAGSVDLTLGDEVKTIGIGFRANF